MYALILVMAVQCGEPDGGSNPFVELPRIVTRSHVSVDSDRCSRGLYDRGILPN